MVYYIIVINFLYRKSYHAVKKNILNVFILRIIRPRTLEKYAIHKLAYRKAIIYLNMHLRN